MQVGEGTSLANVYVTWPHQVKIGDRCRLEHGIYFHYDGIYRPGPSIVLGDNVFVGCQCEFNIRHSIKIEDHASIASGCRFVDHQHATDLRYLHGIDSVVGSGIEIGRRAWLGFGVKIMDGVRVDDGAIVGAGSVVTRSIPANEIWAGVPARRIGTRELGNF